MLLFEILYRKPLDGKGKSLLDVYKALFFRHNIVQEIHLYDLCGKYHGL